MIKRYVVPAHPDHIPYLAEHMSPADVAELYASAAVSPYGGLMKSLEASVLAWTGMVSGPHPDPRGREHDTRPVCMWGVSPIDILGGVGSPWLLGTDELPHHAKTFLKLNRQYIPKMLGLFPKLVNFADVRHVISIRWLKRLGFTFDAHPVPFGPCSIPFYRFQMEKNQCAYQLQL